MFIITVANWKRKLVFFFALLLIITLLFTIIPNILERNTATTNSEPNEDEILSQPIKVQVEPTNDTNLQENKKE